MKKFSLFRGLIYTFTCVGFSFSNVFCDYNGPGFNYPPNPGVADNQNNTVTSSITIADHKTLSVNSTGVLNTMTNNIAGVIIQNYGSLTMENSGSKTLNNIITNGINLNIGSGFGVYNIYMGNINNTISGGITVNATSTFSINNYGYGSANTTINGGISIDQSGTGLIYNGYGGKIVCKISGGLTINGGVFQMANIAGFGSVKGTIDTINLNNGLLAIGGYGSTTNIGTMNWNGGYLIINYTGNNSPGFGETHVDTLNLSGDGILSIQSNDSSIYFETRTLRLLTYTTLNGNPRKVKFYNPNILTEVSYSPDSVNGFTYVPEVGGTFDVVVGPGLTAVESTAPDSIADAAGSIQADLVNNITRTTDMNDFRMNNLIAQDYEFLLKQPHNDHKTEISDMLQAIASQRIPFVKITPTYKLWMTPYFSHTHNDIAGQDGFDENTYGFFVGALKNLDEKKSCSLGITMGGGISKLKMKKDNLSHTDGKQFLLGLSLRKTFFEKLEFIANVNGIESYYRAQRLGQPVPTFSYIAHSRYRTETINPLLEMGYIQKLGNHLSIRPDIGTDIHFIRRIGFTERDAGYYAQTYKTKTNKTSEVYGGMSLRKTITGERFEGKITGVYEIGVKTNHGKISDVVYADSIPDGVRINLPGAGRVTHYVNLYASLLDMKNNLKVYAGVMAAIKNHQKSITASIKFEYRF